MLSLIPFVSHYSVLLLMLSLPYSIAVRCLSCYDDPSNGGLHDTDSCPWVTGIASNVSALATAGAVLSVAKLLPLRVLRVFPKAVLSTLKSLYEHPASSAGQMVLEDSTTTIQMARGIQAGTVLLEDCVLHVVGQMEALDRNDANYLSKFKLLEAKMAAIKNIKPRVAAILLAGQSMSWRVTLCCVAYGPMPPGGTSAWCPLVLTTSLTKAHKQRADLGPTG